MFTNYQWEVDGVEDLTVNQSEETMVGKQRNPADHFHVCVVQIDVLPLTGEFILLQTTETHPKMDEVSHSSRQESYD